MKSFINDKTKVIFHCPLRCGSRFLDSHLDSDFTRVTTFYQSTKGYQVYIIYRDPFERWLGWFSAFSESPHRNIKQVVHNFPIWSQKFKDSVITSTTTEQDRARLQDSHLETQLSLYNRILCLDNWTVQQDYKFINTEDLSKFLKYPPPASTRREINLRYEWNNASSDFQQNLKSFIQHVYQEDYDWIATIQNQLASSD